MLTIRDDEGVFIDNNIREKFKASAIKRLGDLKGGCMDCSRNSFDDLFISSFVLTNWDQQNFNGESYYNLNTPNGVFGIYSQNNNLNNV